MCVETHIEPLRSKRCIYNLSLKKRRGLAQPLIKKEVVNIKNSFLKQLKRDENDNNDIATPPTMMEQLHKTQGWGNDKTNDGNELEKKNGGNWKR